jgi:uncharacterized protein (DUF1810 family)
MADPYNLSRFIEPQDRVLAQVRLELRAGQKLTHWMWFIFPQLAGLGSSASARRYAIASLDEARAYLEHPILGPRLIECTTLVNIIEGLPINQIFGYPDYLKFRSSITLFALANPTEQIFSDALQKYFEGLPDRRTEEMLALR